VNFKPAQAQEPGKCPKCGQPFTAENPVAPPSNDSYLVDAGVFLTTAACLACRLAQRGVPTRYIFARLERCPDLPAAIVAKLREWSESPEGVLYLHSARPGSGKTYCATATLAAILAAQPDRQGQALWRSEKQFTGGDADARRTLSKSMAACGVLCYDDLGASASWDSQRGEIADVIGARYDGCKPTIVTSNLSLNDLAKTFDARLASRLAGDATPIEFPGVDLRLAGTIKAPRRKALA